MLILHSRKFGLAVFILFVVSLAIFPKDSIGLKDLQKKRMTQEERLKKLEAENESLRKEMEGIKNNSIPVEAAKDTLKEPTKDTTKEIAKEKPAESSQVPETSTKSTVIKKYEIKSKGIKIEIEKLDEENQGKRYAILVGVNEYQDKAISKLSKARNDAKIFGKILKDMGQFDQVFVMTDDIDPRNDSENLFPSKLNIEEKLDSILRFTRPDDMIVFFFSGHGVSDMDENGYLIAVDTVVEKQFNTALSINSIVNRFKTHGIKKSLLILDACRDVLYASKSSSRNSILEKEFTGAELAGTFYSTKGWLL
ncbi:MAG: caspase family protein [Leptospiraceae bacterium]|nr:caspase family protein [Leptospiraceae bacterium]